jgi:hypothetical protein
MGEARTNDLHRIVLRYVNWENVDQQVLRINRKSFLPISQKMISLLSRV